MKYYTPTIKEFHVGFEYEHYHEALNQWLPCFYLTDYDQRGTDKLDENSMKTERVKQLDEEDLKKEGFTQLEGEVFQNKKGVYLYLNTEAQNVKLVRPAEDGQVGPESFLFNGTIKNRSELKIVLTQTT